MARWLEVAEVILMQAFLELCIIDEAKLDRQCCEAVELISRKLKNVRAGCGGWCRQFSSIGLVLVEAGQPGFQPGFHRNIDSGTYTTRSSVVETNIDPGSQHYLVDDIEIVQVSHNISFLLPSHSEPFLHPLRPHDPRVTDYSSSSSVLKQSYIKARQSVD